MAFSPQSNEDKVMNKLNQIEQQIKVAEDSIKLHTDNVVVLAAIGDKYGTVRDRAQTLAARVDNIRFNPYLTDEQKVEELAKLYKDGVVYDLETALNGATNAFNGDTEFSLEQKSVFDMAYSTAVEKSMFSQEAIEAATPYLMRQLATYLAGYAALMPVYEAYEQVYGASYLLATREVMAQRLGGVDREGHEMSSTVLQKYEDFFGMDKYIFVNKGQTAPVKLNQTMYYMSGRADYLEVEKEIKNTALTRAQVESLAKYCKDKNLTLNQFLFEKMGFINPKALPKELEGMIAPAKTTYYLLSGAQDFDRSTTDRPIGKDKIEYTYHYRIHGINIDKVGAETERQEYVSNILDKKILTFKNITVFAFQKG